MLTSTAHVATAKPEPYLKQLAAISATATRSRSTTPGARSAWRAACAHWTPARRRSSS